MQIRQVLRQRFLKVISLLALILLVAILVLPSDRPFNFRESDYSVDRKFLVNGTYLLEPGAIQRVLSEYEEVLLWGSYAGNNDTAGKLFSPAFQAPPLLGIFVSGFPNRPGNQFYLQQIDTEKKLNLRVGEIGETWAKRIWFLPLDWWGKKIRVVAIDDTVDGGGWLGVSSPIAISPIGLIKTFVPSLSIVPLYILHFLLFLVPGFSLTQWLIQRYRLHPSLTLILTIVTNAIIGYGAFWIYFFNFNLGRVFSVGIVLFSIYQGVQFFRNSSLKKSILLEDIWIPGSIMFWAGLLYLAILYIADPPRLVEDAPAVRFFNARPPDNIIPLYFAERLYFGLDPRKLIGDWLSSDRPPLQTGLLLSQWVIRGLELAKAGLNYQILSTIIQCSWIPALWALCRTAVLSRFQTTVIFGFCLTSAFFVYNSIYVWPKLLAAAMMMLVYVLLFQENAEQKTLPPIQIALAAAATALALLSHGSALFNLPAFILAFVIFKRRLPPVRQIVLGLAVLLIVYSPWVAYQKFYEPPGDRLVKMHLAGDLRIDQRSALQTLIDAYRNTGLQGVISNKWMGAKNIVGLAPLMEGATLSEDNQPVTRWRIAEREYVIGSAGILNLGWLILIPVFLRKNWRNKTEVKVACTVLGISVLSLISWVLIMWGGNTLIVTHSSYATVALLLFGLATLVSLLPRFLVAVAFVLHIGWFIYVWLITTPPSLPDALRASPNYLMIALSLLTLIPLIQLALNLKPEFSKTSVD